MHHDHRCTKKKDQKFQRYDRQDINESMFQMDNNPGTKDQLNIQTSTMHQRVTISATRKVRPRRAMYLHFSWIQLRRATLHPAQFWKNGKERNGSGMQIYRTAIAAKSVVTWNYHASTAKKTSRRTPNYSHSDCSILKWRSTRAWSRFESVVTINYAQDVCSSPKWR